MHVEPNEGVLIEQMFVFTRQTKNLNFGMYVCFKGRTYRKTSKVQNVGCFGLPYEKEE